MSNEKIKFVKLPISEQPSQSDFKFQNQKIIQALILNKDNTYEKGPEFTYNEIVKVIKELGSELDTIPLHIQLNTTPAKAYQIENTNKTDALCTMCRFQRSQACIDCLFTCQSQPERLLYLVLVKRNYHFKLQQAFGFDGRELSMVNRDFNDPTFNFKEVFCVSDFYIKRGSKRLAIFVDGKQYHQNEKAYIRDGTVTNKLKDLGIDVVRFTAKEVATEVPRCLKIIDQYL